MIRSFGGKDAEALFNGERVRRFQAIARVAQRKLMQLHGARELRDLQIFPGSRLEALTRDRKGQHSVRITINIGYVLSGKTVTLMMLRSPIIIRRCCG